MNKILDKNWSFFLLILLILFSIFNYCKYKNNIEKIEEIEDLIIEKEKSLLFSDDKLDHLEDEKEKLLSKYSYDEYNSNILYDLNNELLVLNIMNLNINYTIEKEEKKEFAIENLNIVLSGFINESEIEEFLSQLVENRELVLESLNLKKEDDLYALTVELKLPILKRKGKMDRDYSIYQDLEFKNININREPEGEISDFKVYEDMVEERIDRILLDFVENKLTEANDGSINKTEYIEDEENE